MTSERLQKIESVLSKRQNDITVVLENVNDPHNISAVMRSCDAIGIQEIYILNTKIPAYEKWGSRSSSSAMKWLTIYQFANAKECFEVIKKKHSHILTTSLTTGAVSLYDLDLTRSVALVFGNEHDGVSDEIKKLADGNFAIPQVGMIRSLNISVACAVTLYEALRQRTIGGQYNKPTLDKKTYEELKTKWILNHDTDQ